jgi:hypothetical protein
MTINHTMRIIRRQGIRLDLASDRIAVSRVPWQRSTMFMPRSRGGSASHSYFMNATRHSSC